MFVKTLVFLGVFPVGKMSEWAQQGCSLIAQQLLW